MQNLQTVIFDETEIDIYKSDGQKWVTTNQFSKALGYERPDLLLRLISRNSVEFIGKTTTVKLTGVEGERLVSREISLINYHGVIRASMLAKTSKAREFRDWAENVLFEVMTYRAYVDPSVTQYDDVVINKIVDAAVERAKALSKPELDPRDKQLTRFERESQLMLTLGRENSELKSWTNACIQVTGNNYFALPSNPQIEKNYPFFLMDIFLDLGLDRTQAFRKATSFGKLTEVKTFCRGKKKQLINNNAVTVNYYGLGDYETLKNIAIQWLQKPKKNKSKQLTIFSPPPLPTTYIQ